jgi:hypothetical protein
MEAYEYRLTITSEFKPSCEEIEATLNGNTDGLACCPESISAEPVFPDGDVVAYDDSKVDPYDSAWGHDR